MSEHKAANEQTVTPAGLQSCSDSGGRGGEKTPALATEPDLFAVLRRELCAIGLVSARLDAATLLYLVVTTRLFARPVSAMVAGPSSAGKSWLVGGVLKLFPPSAYYAQTAMSERALAYDTTPLRHRTLVLHEAAAISGEVGTYMLRSLLSEGHVSYTTVESGKGGLKAKKINRPGPTNLITTTTAISVHPENQTRLLTISINDDRDSMRDVFAEWADAAAGIEHHSPELEPWREFARWIEDGERRVVVPFAPAIARLLPPQAIRMQRDWIQTLALVQASALIHRGTRGRDTEGRIVATLDDYAGVRDLLEPIISQGVEATVRPSVRETVEAVAELASQYPGGVPQFPLRKYLGLDKSVVSRRIADARASGYLRDDDPGSGRPSRLFLGDPLPVDGEVLPMPDAVAAAVPASPSETDATLQPADD